VSHLIDIFLQPGKVFADLKERPTFILPFLVIVVPTVAFVMAYFANVDAEWYKDYMLGASGAEMTAKEMEQARKMMPGASVMMWVSAATALIGGAISMVLYAVYFLVAGKLTGQPVGFRHGLSLATWSNVPSLLASVVGLIGVFSMTAQTPIESLSLLNLDPLFFELPREHAWSGVAKSFSLLTFWTVFLGALGWKTWGRTGWGQAIVVAVVPSLLIYGGMAIFALLK
jgi:Yip1 domain